MEINQAIYGRHSIREYTRETVDERIIRRLINAAVHAPSAVNQQPWTFTVVRDQTLLDRLSREAKAHVLATMAASAHAERFQSMLKDEHFHIFYHAPTLIVISGGAPGQWIVEDCSLAAENLMLTAYAEGLGTCWIGFAQSYLNTTAGKRTLGLPDEWVPVAPVIVGHPQAAAQPVAHKEPQIHWRD